MPVIPTWLEEPANKYLEGFKIGTSIAQERARLNAENLRTQQQAQFQQQNLQRESQMESQRLNVEQAYRQIETDLQKQRLAEAEKVNSAKMQESAQKIAHQIGFNKAVAGGADVMTALHQFPLANAATYTAAQRDVADLGNKRLEQENLRTKLEQDRLGLEQEKARNRTGQVDIEDQVNPRTGNVMVRTKRYHENSTQVPATPGAGGSPYQTKADVLKAYESKAISRDDAKRLMSSLPDAGQ